MVGTYNTNKNKLLKLKYNTILAKTIVDTNPEIQSLDYKKAFDLNAKGILKISENRILYSKYSEIRLYIKVSELLLACFIYSHKNFLFELVMRFNAN